MKFLIKFLCALSLFLEPVAMAQMTGIQRAELRDTNLLGPFNPAFENGKQGWTNTGGTFITITSSALEGTHSASWTPTASGQTLDSKAVTVPAGMVGGQCQGSMLYSGADANTTFEVLDTTTSTILASQVLTSAATPANVLLPFTCPAAGDTIKLRLISTASGSAVVIDKTFLGTVGFTGIASTSPVVFSEPKTVVGSVGTSGQISLGHALTSTEWPFAIAGKLAFYNLNASATTDGSGALSCTSAACTLTNSGTPVAITATDIFGNANSAANFVGASSEVLTNTNAFFNPGSGTSFVVGGWFNSTWGTAYSLVGQWPSNSDRGWNITTDAAGHLFFQVNTTGSATSNDGGSTAATLASGWHHVAMQFNTSNSTVRGYLDGKLVQTYSTSSANQRATSGQSFTIGKDGNVGSFFTGSAFGVFFVNGAVMTDEDIHKVASYTWAHNKSLPAASEWLTGNWYRSDSNLINQLTSGWVVHKDSNTLYTDLSDMGPTSFVDFKMASSATSPVSIPVYSYDSGLLASTPPTTIPHGLGSKPGSVRISYESNASGAGTYQDLSPGDFCSYDNTNLYCSWPSVLVIGPSNQIEIQAWLPGAQAAVAAASATNSGLVNTSAQSFGGAKTFSGAMDASGGWAADTAQDASGTLRGLVSASAQTLGGTKTFNGGIIVPSGQAVGIGTTSPLHQLELLNTSTGSVMDFLGQAKSASNSFGEINFLSSTGAQEAAITGGADVSNNSVLTLLADGRSTGTNAGTMAFVTSNGGSLVAAGSVNGPGAWTFGPSGNTGINLNVNGRANFVLNLTGATNWNFEDDTSGTSTTTGMLVSFPNVSNVAHKLLEVATNIDQFVVKGNGVINMNVTNWATGGTAVGESGGVLTTSPSSRRYKENIAPLDTEIDSSKVFDLKPVVFDYIKEKGGAHSFGLIAEDTYEAVPALVHMEPDPESGELRPESVAYDHLSVLLLIEVKKLKAQNDALTKRLEDAGL